MWTSALLFYHISTLWTECDCPHVTYYTTAVSSSHQGQVNAPCVEFRLYDSSDYDAFPPHGTGLTPRMRRKNIYWIETSTRTGGRSAYEFTGAPMFLKQSVENGCYTGMWICPVSYWLDSPCHHVLFFFCRFKAVDSTCSLCHHLQQCWTWADVILKNLKRAYRLHLLFYTNDYMEQMRSNCWSAQRWRPPLVPLLKMASGQYGDWGSYYYRSSWVCTTGWKSTVSDWIYITYISRLSN